MNMPSGDDQFRELLDRWEDLRNEGKDPTAEDLCCDLPQLTERMRDWMRVLKASDWMCRADDVADETIGEAGVITTEEMERHRIVGEYLLLDELGSGGMGRVFKAVHRKMNRTVALKLLPDALVQRAESVERFHRELQALARLSHPNIVAVHDAGTANGTDFYVMDLIEGDDLARLVKEQGPMPPEQSLHCILQAARGLEYAHTQGIVHRDIKPSNLILDHAGTVKILDLGIARFPSEIAESAESDLTKTGCILGTVDYMAPEQAMNTSRADRRADIYALGCTLHFLLTGKPVYQGDTMMERLVAHRELAVPSLRTACPAAPPWLDGIFRKMVAKKPEFRYQSVTELITDLANQSAPGNRQQLVAAVLAVLLLIAGGWIASIAWHHFDRADQPPGQNKPLDLPVKPSWRTEGEFPLIAGVWSLTEHPETPINIVQHGNEFIATASYNSKDEAVSWRAQGRISRSGHLTMTFAYTHPNPSEKRQPQTRTAVLNLDGKSVEGYAASKDDGRVFTWKLVEPRAATERGLSE